MIRLLEILQNNGVTCYVAEHDDNYGESLPDKLSTAIDKSDVVIVILTHNSKSSSSVNQEIGYAKKAGKRIIPLMEKGVSLPVLLQGVEYESFTSDNWIVSCRKILEFIMRLPKQKQKAQSNSSQQEITKQKPDINKMDWLREKIDSISSLDAEIQRTYASKPSLFNRKDDRLEQLFEIFGNESLQVVRDLQSKYSEFDFVYSRGYSSFFEIAYSNYDSFRKKLLKWHKGRGLVGKIRKEWTFENLGDLEPVIEGAHEFATHMSKFFVDWNKHIKKISS